jgi:hypothetical protein
VADSHVWPLLLREAMDYLVRVCIRVSCTLRLSGALGGGARQVQPVWDLLSLEDALWWMVWFDEFTARRGSGLEVRART